MPAKITPIQRQQVVALLTEGISKQDVSERVGVTVLDKRSRLQHT